jgi:DNA-binding NtrC family response regulator
MQVRLLRTLDSGEVRRVGEDRTFHVDARIVAATAKDLTREAAEGRFRWDLFYRVSTVVVPVPPLRARGGDVPRLVDHFLAPFARVGKAVRFDAEAMELLRAYRWPGNVRELRNLIERLQILREGGEVRVGDLPAEFTGSAHGVRPPAPEPSTLVSLSEMERQHVERVLRATAWNKARAARILDVDIKTLNKKIRDFGLMKSA